MRLMRLIFLVVPILALTFNVKNGKKKQELDFVTEQDANKKRNGMNNVLKI